MILREHKNLVTTSWGCKHRTNKIIIYHKHKSKVVEKNSEIIIAIGY